LIDVHKSQLKGVLFVGIAGTGKTAIVKNYANHVDPETTTTGSINFNSYTDSYGLQMVIQGNVEKRMGKHYGPPPGKKLIFFMDDLNMPAVETYGSQGAICLIRQIIDYKLIFNRQELQERIILVDMMFLACMNPKSGSFHVDLRMTRHLTQVALTVPEREILLTIYSQILAAHFEPFDQGN
jgi:dynein heavy chain